MTDYTKLVEALRCCIPNPPETCEGCTYNTGWECNVTGMMSDAADAIESLQKELDAENYQLKMYSMCPFDDEEEEE